VICADGVEHWPRRRGLDLPYFGEHVSRIRRCRGELGIQSKLIASTKARRWSGWPALGRKRVLRGGKWVSGPFARDGQDGTAGFVRL